MKDKAEKKSLISRDDSSCVEAIQTALHLRGPLQMAVHPRPRSRISFWRDPGLPTASFAKGNQHHFPRRRTQSR